jgi:hypothetical protein
MRDAKRRNRKTAPPIDEAPPVRETARETMTPLQRQRAAEARMEAKRSSGRRLRGIG